MIPTVIWDIDGTLADCEHRRHFVAQQPKNWNKFFELMHLDTPKRDIVALNRVLAHTKAVDNVYCTGRGEEYRHETEAWLLKNVTNGQPVDLRMRPAADYRPDDIIKQEILDQLLSEGRHIWFVVDDRQRVVDMWRRNGITCLQCAPGDFNPFAETDVTGKLLLTLLVGPSGAGKSTLLKDIMFEDQFILSSDAVRHQMTGDFRDQSQNEKVFAYINDTIVTRAAYGLHTVVDATNIKKRDRTALVSLIPKEAKVRYVVVDRPLDEKLRTGGWRLDVKFPQKDGTEINLIEKHHQTMQSQQRDILKGDGLPNVEVVDMRKK